MPARVFRPNARVIAPPYSIEVVPCIICGLERRHSKGGIGAQEELDIACSSTRFGGMNVSDAKQRKALEDENAKLKKLLAETMLDNAMLKDVKSKKW